MIKFYTISPQGVPENPHLFPMMRPTFIEKGNVFVDRIEGADCVLLDLHTRIAEYKDCDFSRILSSGISVSSFDEFDKGGMSHLEWPSPLNWQQLYIFKHIKDNNIKSVHFCRLLDKTKSYQENLFPYEKPILYEEPLLTPEQLFDRPYDVVWIANTAPQREMFKKVLEEDGRLKTKIILGAEKIPLQDWIDAHKEGKMFVSWSAGGAGDEKIQHLFSVAGIIKEANNQLFLHDFTHLENCIRPNPNPTKEDIDTIVEIVNDKERLYEIYKNGYDFVKKYYSAEYIASNILETILKHII